MSLKNIGLRTIRGGEDNQDTAFQNIVIGNFGTTLPSCGRGSKVNFTVKGCREGLGSGAFLSLPEAFITGNVYRRFNIQATAHAFILGITKTFQIAEVPPASKVTVLP